MAIRMGSDGIEFSDSTSQTTKFDTTSDTGKFLAVASYTTAGTYTWDSQVPSITPAAITWNYVGSGVTVSGSSPYTLTHGAAPNAWTQSVYSTESGTNVVAQANGTDYWYTHMMFGLTNNPGASYTNINYAIYFATGALYIYESGTQVAGPLFGSISTAEVYRVTYDGSYVRYYAGASGARPFRTVSAPGLTLKFQAAFYNGGILSGVYFGTLTNRQAKRALVKVTGGGGGGTAYCESGGAGGYSEKTIDTTNVTTVTVTVGSGGAAATYSGGNDGTTSSFGAYASATGGYGSNRNVAHTGGHGGVGSGGDINLYGGNGTGHSNGAGGGAIGNGGTSYWGNGSSVIHASSGLSGTAAPGAGGTGGRTDANWAGNPGASGLVVVYAFT